MSDEIYKPDSDDEYQFTDNEAAVVYKAEKKNFVQNILAQRRIWLAIAIIVIVIVGYKLSDVFTDTKSKIPEKTTVLPELGQSLPKQHTEFTPIKAQSATSEPTPSSTRITSNTAINDERLVQLARHNQESTASLSRMESRLNGINSDFSLLRDELNQLKGDLRAIHAQLNNLQQKLPKPIEQKTAVMTKPKNQKIADGFSSNLPCSSRLARARVVGER